MATATAAAAFGPSVCAPAFAISPAHLLRKPTPCSSGPFPVSVCHHSHARCIPAVLRTSRFHGSTLTMLPSSRQPTNVTPTTTQRKPPRCYAESGGGGEDGGDDDNDDEYDEDPDLLLRDDATGRTLPVGVQCVVPFNDEEYYVCYPMDDPVAFVRAPAKSSASRTGNNTGSSSGTSSIHASLDADDDDDDDELLEPIDDQDTIDKLFPNASAVLSETHLQLQNTPFVLTVSDFSDAVMQEENESLDDIEATDEDDAIGDDRDVQVIAEFVAEGRQYYVVRPVEEVLIIAKAVNSQDAAVFEVLDSNELEKVSPFIEEYIERQQQEGVFT